MGVDPCLCQLLIQTINMSQQGLIQEELHRLKQKTSALLAHYESKINSRKTTPKNYVEDYFRSSFNDPMDESALLPSNRSDYSGEVDYGMGDYQRVQPARQPFSAYEVLRSSRILIFQQITALKDQLKSNKRMIQLLKKEEKTQQKLRFEVLRQKSELVGLQNSYNQQQQLRQRMAEKLSQMNKKQEKLKMMVEQAKMQQIENGQSLQNLSRWETLLHKRQQQKTLMADRNNQNKNEEMLKNQQILKLGRKVRQIEEVYEGMVQATKQQEQIISQIMEREGLTARKLLGNTQQSNPYEDYVSRLTRQSQEFGFHLEMREELKLQNQPQKSRQQSHKIFSPQTEQHLLRNRTVRIRGDKPAHTTNYSIKSKRRSNENLSGIGAQKKSSLPQINDSRSLNLHSPISAGRRTQANTSDIGFKIKTEGSQNRFGENRERFQQLRANMRIRTKYGYSFVGEQKGRKNDEYLSQGKKTRQNSFCASEFSQMEQPQKKSQIAYLYERLLNRKNAKQLINQGQSLEENSLSQQTNTITDYPTGKHVKLKKNCKSRIKGKTAKRLVLTSRESDGQPDKGQDRAATPIDQFPEQLLEQSKPRQRLNTIRERDQVSRAEQYND